MSQECDHVHEKGGKYCPKCGAEFLGNGDVRIKTNPDDPRSIDEIELDIRVPVQSDGDWLWEDLSPYKQKELLEGAGLKDVPEKR